jgi:cytochrome c oxidase subunit III
LSEAVTALASQFRDLEQQREVASLGMWIFLMTELLLFGALFTAYTVYRFSYPQSFAAASRDLEAGLGALNTAVLICSSLGMALAVYGAQTNRRKRLLVGLALAIVLGTVFMLIKGVEYYHHYQHAEFPGLAFDYARPHAREWQVFFFLYFAMTGVHAIHLTVGIVLVCVVFGKAYRRAYSPAYYTPVELSGLYWHFVDIVWLFLFPLLYLIDLHK